MGVLVCTWSAMKQSEYLRYNLPSVLMHRITQEVVSIDKWHYSNYVCGLVQSMLS